MIEDIHKWLDEYKNELSDYYHEDYLNEAINICKDIVAKNMPGRTYTIDLIVDGVFSDVLFHLITMVPKGYHFMEVDTEHKIELAKELSEGLLQYMKKLLRTRYKEIVE